MNKQQQINSINSQEVDINDLSPAMQQFLEIKRKNYDAIILYRMGDFYETFFEDAIVISKDLEIALTSRESGPIGRIPMAGVPAKAIDVYVPKLLEKGHKVAICEQLEDPKQAKGLIKRDIIKTITAGTLTDDSMLVSNSNNYLAAVIGNKNKKDELFGLAYTDITTGEFKVTQAPLNQIIAELARISPAEVLAPAIVQKIKAFQIVPDSIPDLPDLIVQNYNISNVPASAFDIDNLKNNLSSMFKNITISNEDISSCKLGFLAAGAIIYYLIKTQRANLPKFNIISSYSLNDYVLIDFNSRRNLELLETIKDKNKQGSLLWAIDKTFTNMGARLLKKWISQPLLNIEKIHRRQNAISELIQDNQSRILLSDLLKRSSDIERLSMKVSNTTATPRDFIALKNTLSLLPDYQEILNKFQSPYLNCIFQDSDLIQFAKILDNTIKENASISIKEGNIIKDNVKPELDHYRDLITNGNKWLEDYEEQQKLLTNIRTLKVGQSRNFGFFIEVSNSFIKQVPSHYIRKQTLASCERFVTEELKRHESDVIQAQSKIYDLEYKIFCDLREYAKDFSDDIKSLAFKLSRIDVLLSFASVAIENNYICPEIISDKKLLIEEGRHPVIEKMLPLGEYIPNDLFLDDTNNTIESDISSFIILTGPNMAGKSTYMRQNVLIALLAQIGSFVPAKKATIGIVDKIFTRVGAVDDLSLGQSTFMVEMAETAYILNSATEQSLILLDEIGRGTSTYDGVAIAWSVSEYIATKIKARTIFATHYHELNVMTNIFPQIKNYKMLIKEEENNIIFLRKVKPGSISQSYGIHVAKMAGLPKSVINNALKIMYKMQNDYSKDLTKNRAKLQSVASETSQLSLISSSENTNDT